MAEKELKKTIHRVFEGTVVSAKGNKTIVVSIARTKLHPKYGKRFAISKKYKVHDEENRHREGETVKFIECRPLSKDKRWRVLESK